MSLADPPLGSRDENTLNKATTSVIMYVVRCMMCAAAYSRAIVRMPPQLFATLQLQRGRLCYLLRQRAPSRSCYIRKHRHHVQNCNPALSMAILTHFSGR
jgi:hypothetical protein